MYFQNNRNGKKNMYTCEWETRKSSYGAYICKYTYIDIYHIYTQITHSDFEKFNSMSSCWTIAAVWRFAYIKD